MYKNLSASSLGVSGRQSELIELALTYGFRGFDIDMSQHARQAQIRGLEHANRFIVSADIRIGSFQLPVRWQGDDSVYREDLSKLSQVAEVAAAINAFGCITTVMPACDDRPYHENFEFHRRRFSEIAGVLAPFGIRLGLGLLAPAHHREGHQFQFISSPDALLTLMKTVGAPNVGAVVDLWHWHVGGGSFDQLRELTAEQIVLVRMADVPADVPLDGIQDEQRLLPGATGVVDAQSVLSLLDDIGYRGPISAYPHPSCFSGKTRDQIVQAASESLRLGVRASEPVAALAEVAEIAEVVVDGDGQPEPAAE